MRVFSGLIRRDTEMTTKNLTKKYGLNMVSYLSILLLLISFPLKTIAEEDTGNTLYFVLPQTTDDAGLRSDLVITNTEQHPAQVQINAYDQNGLPVSLMKLSIY